MSKPSVHCLKHVPYEGPGMIADYLKENNISLDSINLYENQPLPDINCVDYLIVMGGPMDINDEEQYPWLKEEKALISKIIEAGKPIMGICLGAQLIANELGASVYPAEDHEIGWYPITFTDEAKEHQATASWEENPTVFHWHSNTFDLPRGAIHWASTNSCPNQAFIVNENIIGLQFHLEIARPQVQKMIDNWGRYKESGPYVQSPEEMLEKSKTASETRKMLHRVLDYWVN